MADSKIQWTNKTWNPTTGCTKLSAGCANCYAEREWRRLSKNPKHVAYGRRFTNVKMHPKRLDYPLHIRKPAMFFVDSISDLFHESVTDEFIGRVFKRMALCPQHIFQILTKRATRMLELLKGVDYVQPWVPDKGKDTFHIENVAMPLPNVWLGVSCEDQATADERIPLLLQTPAAVRFISAEPQLGPIDISFDLEIHYQCPNCGDGQGFEGERCSCGDGIYYATDTIDWVIVGGESGKKARPMHPDWPRSLRDQCQAAGVPFFLKQWGEFSLTDVPAKKSVFVHPDGGVITETEAWAAGPTTPVVRMIRVGKKAAGRLLDGKEWSEYPK
jgi:protein gp37